MSQRLLILSPLFLLAGCASISPERGHAEVADALTQRMGIGTGWESGPPEDERIVARVDELLKDGLTRQEAVAIALMNNRQLQATYEELGISQAEMVQAGLLANPSVTASLGFPTGGGGSINEFEFSLTQDFLSLFVLPLRKKVAAEQFAADTARVSGEAFRVATDTSEAFVDLQAAEKLLELRRTIATAAAASADLANKLFEAGNTTELERSLENAANQQAQLETARAELMALESRERLNRLLGLFGGRTAWTLATELPALPEADPDMSHLEARALRERLDVQAARKQVEMFDRSVSLTKTWRWFGRIEVGVDTHRDPDGPRLVGPSLTLELPVFDQRQAAIARLEAVLRQSERRLDAVSVDARSEVRLAVAEVAVARQMAARYQKVLLPLRARSVDLTQLQYNAMQVGLFQLVSAKQAQVEAMDGYVEALRDYWRARARLDAAVGTSIGREKQGAR